MSEKEIPEYRAPLLFRQGHLSTLVHHFFRPSAFQYHRSERIITADSDFFLVDRFDSGSSAITVILHGLEGHSGRPYVRNMAAVAAATGTDVAALNFRSCKGGMNEQARFYHSGETGDLACFIEKIKVEGKYQSVFLAGFSLGGNVLLKYLGEKGSGLPEIVKAALAVSAPVDLATSAQKIEHYSNRLYLNRFLKSLKQKVRQKMEKFPDAVDWERGLKATTFFEFDDAVTAPLHGFNGAADYYANCSSLRFLPDIEVPALLLNAKDDPFLSDQCYPDLGNHPRFRGHYPMAGGHVAFSNWPLRRASFSELLLKWMIQTYRG